MRTSERSLRLAGVLKELLPGLISPHLNPSVHGIVTVDKVEVSGDLGVVLVYLTRIGGTAPFLGPVRKAKREILKKIAARVNMRRLPELRFAPLKDEINL